MFSDVLSTLTRQGLHRANAPLVEVWIFNYERSAAGRLAHLEVLPAGDDLIFDLMITMTPDAGRIRLDHNLDILDAATSVELEGFRGCSRRWRTIRRRRSVRCRIRRSRRRLAVVRSTSGTAVDVPEGAPEGTRHPPRRSLALAATFALGNLPLLCEAAVEEGAWDGGLTVAEAPYHQVLAALRDPCGVFADPTAAVGVALLRAADMERFGPVDDALLAELRTAFPAALRAVSERTRKPLIVGFLPSAHARGRFARWEREVADELAEVPGIAVLRPDDGLDAHAVEEPFDERTERIAHLPFTPHFQAAVALCLADVVRADGAPRPR